MNRKKCFQLLLVVFWMGAGMGCAKKTVPAASGTPGGSNAATLSVLCYNIHHANPPSKPGLIDMDAIAAVIRQQAPDVVALQEVDVYTNRSGKGLHQAEELARKTGMKAWFAKAINHDGGEYGVAILSKYPMEDTIKYALPTAAGTNGEPRILATAVLTLPGNRKIRFACTHLDAQRSDTNRRLQVQQIVDILKGETRPVVIAGDFNAGPETPVMGILDAAFTRTCTTGCGFTIPVINPTRTIDFIAYRPASAFRVEAHQVINEQYASDHLPVKSVLRLQD